MPRYEFCEGSSNKFWEISRDGSIVTTRWGRIGTDGQSKDKDLGSDEKAIKEYNKLIEQKTGKGYELVGEKAPETAPAAPAAKKAAKKKAAKKSETEAAPPPSETVEVEPGWVRYEFREGNSSKFWEIRRDEETVITRYGRIGSDGKETENEHETFTEAREEAYKLVGQKTKKGYQLVGRGVVGAQNLQLEAEIVKDPDNPEAYAVYGDWLQARGDPRGELISLQMQLADESDKDKIKELKTAEKKLLEANVQHFFGEPHPGADKDKPKNEKTSDWQVKNHGWPETGWNFGYLKTFWKNGFVYALVFDPGYYYDGEGGELGSDHASELLSKILDHPSMRFVREIYCADIWADYDMGEGPVLDEAVSAVVTAPCTDTLELLDFVGGDHDINGVSCAIEPTLFSRCPRLHTLRLYGGDVGLCKIDWPEGRELSVYTGALSKAAVKEINKAKAPKLEVLDLLFGDSDGDYGGDTDIDDTTQLLKGKLFPNLQKLGLRNAPFADELVGRVAKSPLLGRIKELDLSLGTLSNAGAQALIDNVKVLGADLLSREKGP
jgi:uncharacterized protein (TIGR02996 family)